MNTSLPWYAKWLLRGFFESYDSYFLHGDLEEAFFMQKETRGLVSAHLWLVNQLFKSMPPVIIDNIFWSLTMFGSYIKIAYRNILKNKIYSTINITGLVIGLVSCLLIYMFVSYELGFDKHHSNFDNIYRVNSVDVYPDGTYYDEAAPFPMAEALRDDFPEFNKVTHIYYGYNVEIKSGEDLFTQDGVVFTDSSFLDVFDFEFLTGNPKQIMKNKNFAAITEEVSQKLFGSESPIGKRITLDNLLDFEITGVIKNPPMNSNIPVNILVPVYALTEEFTGLEMDRWGVATSQSEVFVLVPDNVNMKNLDAKFEDFKKKYLPEQVVDKRFYSLQPLSDIHNNTVYSSFTYTTSRETIYILSAVGILILLIAGVNYVNLSTAQSVKRSKEVGMRKVLGANRAQLIRQLLGESIVYTSLAVIIALVLTQFSGPYLSQFMENRIDFSLLENPSIIFFLAAVFAVTVMLTGFYPAVFLSRYNPVEAIKNKLLAGRKKTTFSLRNGLVVFQFVVSQILIIATIVVSTQMEYFRTKDLGFRKSEIVTIPIGNPDESKRESFINSLKSIPTVQEISLSVGAPISDAAIDTWLAPEGGAEDDRISVFIKVTDENYLDLFNIKLLAGEYLAKYTAGDTLYKFVVNNSLLTKLGITNPQNAIGKFVSISRFRGEIIGVVDDFHFQSLHEDIAPLVITNFLQKFISEADVKISGTNIKQTVEAIEAEWKNFYPDYTFTINYFDEYLNSLYKNEDRLFSIIKVFALLAIAIGCMGLLGLVSFTVVQKTKEIGVRKVLGASSASIFAVISKEFAVNVAIANLIAWPAAYYFLNGWLQNFAYRIEIQWWMFLAAGIIAIVITLLSVSLQSAKAAFTNPGNSLKYE